MRADVSSPLFGSAYYWLALLLAPLPLAAVSLATRVRARPAPSASEDLRRASGHALATAGDRAALRRAFTRALVDRAGVTSSLLADGRSLARALRRAGVSAAAAHEAESVLGALDEAVYALD